MPLLFFSIIPALARTGCRLGVLLVAFAAALMPGQAEAGDPQTRALIVGIDRYPILGAVDGAAANAADLAAVLLAQGAQDIDVVTGAAANVVALRDKLKALAGRTQPGDIVLFAFGGLGGAFAPDQAGRPGVAEAVLLLPGATAREGDTDHRLTGADMLAFINAVETRGGRVVVVADASFGQQTVRRHEAQTAASRTAGSTVQESAAQAFGIAPDTLRRSIILAASEPRFASVAVAVPGRPSPRRPLTYAVARALAGNADFHRDGRISAAELVAYAARLVYQLSDQREKIAAVLPLDLQAAQIKAKSEVRGIVVTAADTLGDLPPDASTVSDETAVTTAPAMAAGPDLPAEDPIRVAAATGDATQFANLSPAESRFVTVRRTDEPDLIWNGSGRDVVTGDGDLVAESIDIGALGGIVDRTTALRQLKSLIVSAPQQIMVLPDDDVQKRGNTVKVRISNAFGRALVLFNIRGDGVVQFLYPRSNDPPIVTSPDFTLALEVNDPLGADQIVAVTGSQRLSGLEEGLSALANRKTPVAAVKLVHDLLQAGSLVGSVGVFSGAP